jgi:Bacterial capsule synthesis protein PGA_cap
MTVYGTPRMPPPPDPPPGRRSRAVLLFILAVAVVLVGAGSVGAVLVLRGHGTRTPVAAPAAKRSASHTASPSAPAAGAGGSTFTLSAVGDTIVAAAPSVPPNGGKGFFDDVRAALTADLQMGNLEEPITNDTGVSKCGADLGQSCFAFRAPPSYVRALKEAGFSLMNLANNHALDFGEAGHQQTEATLTAAGIKYTGPPGMITTTTVKGITVAVVGFAPYPWANSLTDIPAAVDLVKKAKSQATIVIVQAHVGAEGSDKTHVRPGTEYFLGENRGDSIAFGHAVVDAGADIVIMHGPHVMRGMEFYQGHLIAYSMGNFAGYHALSTSGVLGISGVLRVTLDRDGHFVAGKLVATEMVAPGVPRMDPDHRAWSQMRSLSRSDFPSTGAKIGTDGAITPP